MRLLKAFGIFLAVVLGFALLAYIFNIYIGPMINLKSLTIFKILLVIAHLGVISGIYIAWKYFKGTPVLDYSNMMNGKKKNPNF